jgi:hypothetical protein
MAACGRSYSLGFWNSAPKSSHLIFAAWKQPFPIDSAVPLAAGHFLRKRTLNVEVTAAARLYRAAAVE